MPYSRNRYLYEAARKRAGASPADPLRITGHTPGQVRAAAAELSEPCVTPLPGERVCGHANCLHALGTRKGVKVPTWCTIITADGPCGCPLFTTGGDKR